MEGKIKNLAPETRYRVYLDLADACKFMPKYCKKLYEEAVQTAKKFCTEEANRKRAYRHIYISILSSFVIEPDQNVLEMYPKDDHLRFLVNKARYVRGEPLIEFAFNDWKYYLHFCLEKKLDLLKQCYKDSNQGRVLAEYIHVLRLKREPLAVLKLWR